MLGWSRAVIVLALMLLAGRAEAAPFCLPIAGAQPLCIYNDAGDCNRQAAANRESCLVNPAEIQLPPSPRAYCSVTSATVVQCLYDSFDSCYANTPQGTGFCFPSAAVHSGSPEPDRLKNATTNQ